MNYDILEFDSSNIKILNNIETISGIFKVNGIDKFQETSNFIILTSNILLQDTSNFIISTSNILTTDNSAINNIGNQNTSNFIISTSNIISDRITNLNADDIADGTENKYIINNIYSTDLTVSGDFTVNGVDTTINSVLHSSNYVDIINTSANTAFTIKQYNEINDVFSVLNTTEELFKIESNGNIGIGTTPFRKLDVNGDINFTGKLYNGDSEFITSYMLKEGNDILFSNNIIIKGDLTTSNLTILGDSTTLETNVFTTERLEINNIGTGTGISVTQLGGTDDIFTASNSSREVFNIINNGNVGIGITNPGVSLHVAGTDGIVVPVGTEEERPSENIIGLIRYNTTISSFEGYGSTWGSLGGVKDVDGDTYISAENNPGDNNDELKFFTKDVERMVITSNGLIGIGTTNPAAILHVEGEIISTNKITSYYSDERLKTDIEFISEPLNIIEQLNGFYYKPNELAKSLGIKSNKRELGLSAQEVNKVLPELVDLAPLDIICDNNNNIISKSGENYLTISYDKIIPVIIESIKKLNSEIKLLKEENKLLKEAIN